MTKQLNTASIRNELEGASLFFSKPTTPPPAASSSPPEDPAKKAAAANDPEPTPPKARPADSRDTMRPRHHGTAVSRYHDATIPPVHTVAIERVRKAVKEFGKEAATHRFTAQEKKEIADLIYTYKSQGLKTSENEIARIAINFLIQDYRQNGEGSVLHKVLAALNE